MIDEDLFQFFIDNFGTHFRYGPRSKKFYCIIDIGDCRDCVFFDKDQDKSCQGDYGDPHFHEVYNRLEKDYPELLI